jgi:hypothetical protein
MQATGQGVGNAQAFLAAGDAAEAAGDYKGAYANYGKAYRAAASESKSTSRRRSCARAASPLRRNFHDSRSARADAFKWAVASIVTSGLTPEDVGAAPYPAASANASSPRSPVSQAHGGR